ncbi:hypothetical protein COV20_05255 [Candidatus Woesearchaeota archaeon CG10_big_fil_rev_8_21_14_0_10_45_16]|nr:MAG: hypothetical protein COV20_05255 [Candidatus Woesearchaeota archaeon CG10_big_fil_rev_8_21_14_0_10_45_16]
MIRRSFVFLEKVRSRKEQTIWQQGIKDWNDFLRAKEVKGISLSTKSYYDRQIREAQKALRDDNSSYFIGKLPQKEMWRLYDHFKEECCYLDIEVDSHGKVVVVGISDYYDTRQFVKGVNLEKGLLEKELQRYRIMVTFNGSSFDLPKLKKELKIKIDLPHIDLKPLCVNLGFKGGLKEVEKILDLKRPPHLYGNPVDLWKAFHASHDKEYLDLLLHYNAEDIENLKAVMIKMYKEMVKKI